MYGAENADSCIICGMENHIPDEIKDTAGLLYESNEAGNCCLIIYLPVVQKVMGGKDINRPGDMKKLEAIFRKGADWLKSHPEYESVSWNFNFDETKHRDGVYYHFTSCPIERYAREHDLIDVLPICCDNDYEIAKPYHAKLHREHTLASGGQICDYWFVPDQIKNPK